MQNNNAPSAAYLQAHRALHGTCEKPKFHRHLLPDPTSYYTEQLELKTKRSDGWASALCVFHDDNMASLSVNLDHGGFNCFACEAKGGDVVDFHKMRLRLSFVDAVKDLGAWQ